MGSIRLEPGCDIVEPRSPGQWRDTVFLPGQRWSIERTTGGCLASVLTGKWTLIDRYATIRVGDVVLLRLADQANYFWTWRKDGLAFQRLGWRLFATGMIKRFLGTADGRLAFEHTNPPAYYETDDPGVRTLYRVVAVFPTYSAAVRAWWTMRRG